MPFSIPGSFPAEPTSVEHTPPAPQAVVGVPQTVELSTVTLSQTSQVLALQQQGLTPSAIAENLGIPLATVNGDLGIIPEPAPTPAPVQGAVPAQGGAALPATPTT